MFGRRTVLAMALAFAFVVAGQISTARATLVTKVLGDSGWSVQFDNAGLSITLLNPPADASKVAHVVIEKVAQFTEGPNEFGFIDPLELSFIQNNALATPQIVIDREVVYNDTGLDWTSFRMIIEDPMKNIAGGAVFDQAASASFDVSPFTSKQFISTATEEELLIAGGVLSDGEVWTPGADEGALVINAHPFTAGSVHRSFVFKEQPQGGEAIPLPAAAFSGLSSLLGLGTLGAAKKLRRRVA
jgi:hypothetical protein